MRRSDLTCLSLALLLAGTVDGRAQEVVWGANGRDVAGTRYSPAAQIQRTNVSRLEVVWTYRTGETGSPFETRKTPSFETTPLVSDASGLPCTPPPFGALVAIDVDTGARRWQAPLGSMDALAPPGVELPSEWGSVNLGGPIATAGGLVFIAAALDRSLHAFDIETAKSCGAARCPRAAGRRP